MTTISKTYLKDLVYHINGAAIEVHKHLGPGLLENIYHKCLVKELADSERLLAELTRSKSLFTGANIFTRAEGSFIKAVDKVLPIHEAQLMTYMKLLKVPIGLIINFNVTNIYKEGQKTYVNELYRNLEE